MVFLTDFADQAVVLPVVAIVAIVLFAMGWRRGALVWLGAVGATFGVILVLKLGFLACGPLFAPWALRSPSGHTAAASVVAGGFTVLLGGRALVAVTVSLLAALLIGTSRLELGFHSVHEVLMGAAVGIAGSAAISLLVGPRPVLRPLPLLAVAVVVALVVHGMRLPAEDMILRVAHHMLDFIPACRGDVPS
jgi:membrane-associated phospholipid phosphatase